MPDDDRGRIAVRPVAGKGLGIVATQPIAAGAIIATNRCLLLDAAETRAIGPTRLARYVFAWGGSAEGPVTAVALGDLSFCNHSSRPNAAPEYDDAGPFLSLRALVPIAQGTEITIDYIHPLDFEPAG